MIAETLKDLYPQARILQASPNDIFIFNYNWNYEEALEAQYKCIDYVRENPNQRFYFYCSHPNTFTVGTGLQRDAKSKGIDLRELTEEEKAKLPFPTYSILRGGGLTFHHPGQLVIYPIVSVTYWKTRPLHLIHGLLEIAQRVLEKEFNIKDITHHKELLGLWAGPKKVASVGIGLKAFVSHHGMAINIENDEKMSQALAQFAPCGLNSTTYSPLSSWNIDREAFERHFFDEHTMHLDSWFGEDYWRERQ